MLNNYLRIAFRHLSKQKLHSGLNIAGLTLGMTVSILIISYIWFELSFGRFHSKTEQTYRFVKHVKFTDREVSVGLTGYGLASALSTEFPEIDLITRLDFIRWEAEISHDGNIFIEKGENIIVGDVDLLKIFDIRLIHGDPESALQDPNSIILTEDESRRIFGNESAIGKFIQIRRLDRDEQYNLRITGIARDLPANAHFRFKYIIPVSAFPPKGQEFMFPGYCTYLTLPAGYPPGDLEGKLPGFVKKYYAPVLESLTSTPYDEWVESGGYMTPMLQPLKDIHFERRYDGYTLKIINKGNLFHVQMYSVIALFIIALACINFITLSTARSGSRAKEVGVRKVLGAIRMQLIRQFLSESILLGLIALMLSIPMVILFFRPFNDLLEIQTSHSATGIVVVLTSLILITLIIGVLAGSYPAFILSSFRPVEVLKGKQLERKKGIVIRNSLVVFQFIISLVLIISCTTVYKQFVYMQNKDLGCVKENIIIVKNMGAIYRHAQASARADRELRMETFRQEVMKHANVVNSSLADRMPSLMEGDIWMTYVRLPGGVEYDGELLTSSIDCHYHDLFGLEMVAGNNFRKSATIPETREGVIINERAADYLGLRDPVGEYIYTDDWVYVKNLDGTGEWTKQEIQIPILGVIKDFNILDLYSEIGPHVFFPLYKGHYTSNLLAVRFLPGDITENIGHLEQTWNKFTDEPFDISFFDEELERQYFKEMKLARVFSFFAILSIIIACLGVYGLAAHSLDQRTKEIGIRKVMGASVMAVLKIFSRDYLKLLIIASLIACPGGYILMDHWLRDFPYHTNAGAGIYILAIVMTALIILFSISYTAIKAARTDPASTLKYE